MHLGWAPIQSTYILGIELYSSGIDVMPQEVLRQLVWYCRRPFWDRQSYFRSMLVAPSSNIIIQVITLPKFIIVSNKYQTMEGTSTDWSNIAYPTWFYFVKTAQADIANIQPAHTLMIPSAKLLSSKIYNCCMMVLSRNSMMPMSALPILTNLLFQYCSRYQLFRVSCIIMHNIFSQTDKEVQNIAIIYNSPLLKSQYRTVLQIYRIFPTTPIAHKATLHFGTGSTPSSKISPIIMHTPDALRKKLYEVNDWSSQNKGIVNIVARTKAKQATEYVNLYAYARGWLLRGWLNLNILAPFLQLKFDYKQMSLQSIFDGKSKRQFLNADKISLHLRCSICHDIFQDPVRTACGHTYCYICIQNWLRIDKACPLCKQSTQKRKLEKDLIAHNIVNDLPAKCVYQKCKWKGIYLDAKKHQRLCTFRPKKEELNNIELAKVVEIANDEQYSEVEIISLDESES